jgi:hypothetical protein
VTAGARFAAFFSAATSTILARYRPVEVNHFFTTGINLAQRNGEPDFEIATPGGASRATVPAKKIAEQATSAEIEPESSIAEYIAEIDTGKQVFGGKICHTRETARRYAKNLVVITLFAAHESI